MSTFTDTQKKDIYNSIITGVLAREYDNPNNPEMFGYLYELGTPVVEGRLEGIIARRILRKLHKHGKIPHLKIPHTEYLKAIDYDVVYGEPED